jgi:AbiV family abortive infection protein
MNKAPFNDDLEPAAPWETFVAPFLSGKQSILALLRSAPWGNYEAFVRQARVYCMLLSDPRIPAILNQEMRSTMREAGFDPDDDAISKALARKDGHRRFRKLIEERARAVNTQPSLLTGSDFPTRLAQYQSLIGHVETRWAEACSNFGQRNFPLAAFFSILVIEEVGKLSRLAEELIYFDVPVAVQSPKVVERSHRRKHFIAVVSGALINARLDRVLGKDTVRKILHEAESDELEKTRQACLYIDIEDGRAMTPAERIDEIRARDLTVLAGEVMAEVLGHFPWEFERMMEQVIAFERLIGVPEIKIARL